MQDFFKELLQKKTSNEFSKRRLWCLNKKKPRKLGRIATTVAAQIEQSEFGRTFLKLHFPK